MVWKRASRPAAGTAPRRPRPACPHLVLAASLALTLLACCPAPLAGVGDPPATSFAAEIVGLSPSVVTARLSDGREVQLEFRDAPPAGLAAGSRIYVEGTIVGRLVRVLRISSLG